MLAKLSIIAHIYVLAVIPPDELLCFDHHKTGQKAKSPLLSYWNLLDRKCFNLIIAVAASDLSLSSSTGGFFM